MLVLGVESSCDETSVAIVKDGKEVLSNVINSQIDIHKLFLQTYIIIYWKKSKL